MSHPQAIYKDGNQQLPHLPTFQPSHLPTFPPSHLPTFPPSITCNSRACIANRTPNPLAINLTYVKFIAKHMKAKTERLLYLMLWTGESLMRPTWRNLNSSFEQWAYRNGLLHQLWRLEKEEFLERRGEALTTVHRLTKKGRLKAWGGINPIELWNRDWDGKWRIAFFDVSEAERNSRHALRQFLRRNRFGCLQKSVWVSPDPVAPFAKHLRGFEKNAKAFSCFEGTPCTNADDRQIAAKAWDFQRIQECHEACLSVLQRPPKGIGSEADAQQVLAWAEEERQAWAEATWQDPFLPKILWPKGYLGEKVWKTRVRVLKRAGQLISGFKAP